MPVARPGLAIGMTTVGFIGSGRIGGTVARLAIAAGYDVVLSNSRGLQALKDLVEELGTHAGAAAPAGAAEAGDLVVVSIPPRAYPAVPVEPLAGKPVLDTINYIPQRDGRIRGARWLAVQQRGAPAAPRYGARGQGVQQHHLLALRLAGPCGRRGRP
jgi:predicted dinucleotide-binding enzyme